MPTRGSPVSSQHRNCTTGNRRVGYKSEHRHDEWSLTDVVTSPTAKREGGLGDSPHSRRLSIQQRVNAQNESCPLVHVGAAHLQAKGGSSVRRE